MAAASSKGAEVDRKVTDLTYSLGLVIGNEGRITDVLWQGPAFEKALAAGTQIVAVDGVAFSGDRIKDAIRDAKANSSRAIELLVKTGDRYRTIRIDYHDGLRYPHLERDANLPARLDAILSAR